MALLVIDGFEDSRDADYPNWPTSRLYAGMGRRGGRAIGATQNSSYINYSLSSATSTIFFHLAVNPNSPTNFGYFIRFLSDATIQVAIGISSAGEIVAYRNTTEIGRSAAGVLPLGNAYTSISGKIVISDTVGVVEIRLNGGTTPVLNLTGVDTRNGTPTTVNIVQAGSASIAGLYGNTTTPVYFDDLVAWDVSGSVNNDWLGDLRVDSYMPNGDGDSSDMTPSTGTSHWELVDEVPSSSADYVQSSTVGHMDLFHTTNMGHTPTVIHGVMPVAQMLKDDAGSREVAIMLKSGATESQGSNIALSTTSLKYGRILELNPNGNVAWTKAAVDAAQVGVKVTA